MIHYHLVFRRLKQRSKSLSVKTSFSISLIVAYMLIEFLYMFVQLNPLRSGNIYDMLHHHHLRNNGKWKHRAISSRRKVYHICLIIVLYWGKFPSEYIRFCFLQVFEKSWKTKRGHKINFWGSYGLFFLLLGEMQKSETKCLHFLYKYKRDKIFFISHVVSSQYFWNHLWNQIYKQNFLFLVFGRIKRISTTVFTPLSKINGLKFTS